jgi:RNA polymerase sigma-70 factor (ECF subfamily)
MNRCVQNDSASSDFELVERTRQGDTTAFGELVNRYYHRCAKLARFILGNRADGSDEVQNACRKALEHFDQYQGTAAFGTWFSTIVINECRMVFRRNGSKKLVNLDGFCSPLDVLPVPGVAEDPELDLIRRDMTEVIRREVRHLPTIMRDVMLLRDVGGLSMLEVAARLGITVPAAKSRLVRARLELRSRVSPHFGANAYCLRSSVRTLPARSAACSDFLD